MFAAPVTWESKDGTKSETEAGTGIGALPEIKSLEFVVILKLELEEAKDSSLSILVTVSTMVRIVFSTTSLPLLLLLILELNGDCELSSSVEMDLGLMGLILTMRGSGRYEPSGRRFGGVLGAEINLLI